ncbi:hypothetical protein [Okeania sp. SIO2C2]|uniref:DUF6887 family protein n=1 Tax=Okeania sp. SIO2C2 TaxID=2607787 RepID=UPI0035C8DA62
MEFRNYVLVHLENIETFYALLDPLKEKLQRTLSEKKIDNLSEILADKKHNSLVIDGWQ